MNGSKYHDYRVLKIAIFVILVIVGLLLYINLAEAPHEHTAGASWSVETPPTCTEVGERCKVCTSCGEKFGYEDVPATGHNYQIKTTDATCVKAGSTKYTCKNCTHSYTETIPATGVHVPGDKVNENVKVSTCTEGGSHDEVTKCKHCDVEMSRETVQDTHKPVFKEISRSTLVPTSHTVPGADQVTYKCELCEFEKTEMETVNAVGHTYSWELVCTNNAARSFAIVGTCSCNETGNVVTLGAQDGVVVEDLDETIDPCCKKEFKGTVTYGEEEITVNLTIKLDSHRVVNSSTGMIANADDIISADGRYYDYNKVDPTYGNIRDYVNLLNAENFEDAWDYRGLAYGYIYCIDCGEYYSIRIYNADFDTTI